MKANSLMSFLAIAFAISVDAMLKAWNMKDVSK